MPSAAGVSLARATAQGQADVLHLRVQRRATPRVARRETRELLGESVPWARHNATAEPPHAPMDDDTVAADRGVGDMADVVGVNVAGASWARRAPGASRDRLDVEGQLIVGHSGVKHTQPAQVGEQGGQAHDNLLVALYLKVVPGVWQVRTQHGMCARAILVDVKHLHRILGAKTCCARYEEVTVHRSRER